jgi:hypothetical protein
MRANRMILPRRTVFPGCIDISTHDHPEPQDLRTAEAVKVRIGSASVNPGPLDPPVFPDLRRRNFQYIADSRPGVATTPVLAASNA